MGTKYYAAICGKGHLRYYNKQKPVSDADKYCQKCGKEVYSKCPECSEPIKATNN